MPPVLVEGITVLQTCLMRPRLESIVNGFSSGKAPREALRLSRSQDRFRRRGCGARCRN